MSGGWELLVCLDFDAALGRAVEGLRLTLAGAGEGAESVLFAAVGVVGAGLGVGAIAAEDLFEEGF